MKCREEGLRTEPNAKPGSRSAPAPGMSGLTMLSLPLARPGFPLASTDPHRKRLNHLSFSGIAGCPLTALIICRIARAMSAASLEQFSAERAPCSLLLVSPLPRRPKKKWRIST
jgi:hypothetical protein